MCIGENIGQPIIKSLCQIDTDIKKILKNYRRKADAFASAFSFMKIEQKFIIFSQKLIFNLEKKTNLY